ncbi:hypothetical protein NSU_0777 [Novosphingobium pentaromativorans US6-1]|uniref:Uncharacterized protein n=1 Tax=Novosphingobium pentaromativorans US6-1 TaxID=1088721 RepID=G6E8V6_9SPHN|nr:hypothetical protein NSU_0777 [Novosphingobium pentaromativorans US6-1]
MSHFERLIACIRSGQMSEAQISEELRNPVFASYYRQRA